MSDFWNEFREAFKTKKQRDRERTQKLKEALTAEKAIDEKMENLEKEYQAYLDSQKEEEPNLEELFPTSLGLEKIEYTPETDESITDRATAKNTSDKTKAVEDVVNKYGEKTSALEEKIENENKAHEKKDRDLEELYDSLRKSGVQSGVKNGIARGSIVSGILDNINRDESVSREQAYNNYLDGIEAINGEIDKLNEEKQIALDELDMKYASDLDNQIAKLKAERDATVAKYVKYNNNVDEKEKKYAVQRQKNVDEFLTAREKKKEAEEKAQAKYEAQYGYSGEKLKNYNERYKLAYDFYMGLDPDIALSALESSPNMSNYLGNNYSKLKKELNKRALQTTTNLRIFY